MLDEVHEQAGIRFRPDPNDRTQQRPGKLDQHPQNGVLRVKLARHPDNTKQGQHSETEGQEYSEHGQAPFRAGERDQLELG